MSEVKRCAACGKENLVREMKTCMHSQMHYYVCDSKCMDDFYNPPKKPTERELRIKAETERDALAAECERLREETAVLVGEIAEIEVRRDAALAELAALKPFCEYCGGNDEFPQDHCVDCTRPAGDVAALKGGQVVVAMIRYARGVPGFENEMPHVVSCNDLPDGLYPVYLAPPAQASAWVAVSERLPVHLELVLVWLAYSDDEGERQETIDFADFHAPSQDNQWFSPYAFSAEQHPHVTHWQPITAPTPGASDGNGGDV